VETTKLERVVLATNKDLAKMVQDRGKEKLGLQM